MEDWDQRLFAWLWRGGRRLSRSVRRLAGAELGELPGHAVRLPPLSSRLRILGSALSGAAVEIHPAEGSAGVRGATLLLPPSLALGESPEEGIRGYLFCVAYQSTVLRLGLRLPAEGMDERLPSWIAMRVALPELLAELPGSARLLAALRPSLLASRPPLEGLRPGELALELSLREALGAPPPDPPPPALRALLGALREVGPEAREAPVFDSICARLGPLLGALGGAGRTPPLLLFGSLRPAAPEAGRAGGPPLPASALATGTEREGRAREAVRRVHLDDKPVADNPLVHSFEKVHTAEEHRGGQKALDGRDELEDHLEALEELDLREVIRTRERTSSLLRADALLNGSAPELSDATPARPPDFVYDEWDGRARRYRHAHCNLYLEKARKVRPAAAQEWIARTRAARRRELSRLRLELSRIELERRPRARQRDGDRVDIDAGVDARATVAAGHSPSDRLYIRSQPDHPALAVMLLLDLSLSSDAYVEGTRVLDVSREAAFVVGEALSEELARLSVCGFHSNTRRDCRFVVLKGFDAPWPKARGLLVGLTPRGYTRVGPAIRHATASLRGRPERRRALLIVTDGQPTDYDRYEGRHGVEDVRQAVREAARDGIACFALAVSATHRPQLGRMFGRDRYALLPRADRLPDAMGDLLLRLIR